MFGNGNPGFCQRHIKGGSRGAQRILQGQMPLTSAPSASKAKKGGSRKVSIQCKACGQVCFSCKMPACSDAVPQCFALFTAEQRCMHVALYLQGSAKVAPVCLLYPRGVMVHSKPLNHCGMAMQTGHNSKNKICPMYTATHRQAVDEVSTTDITTEPVEFSDLPCRRPLPPAVWSHRAGYACRGNQYGL
jgi:hypothetical protein